MLHESADIGFVYARTSNKRLIEKAKSANVPVEERVMALNALRLRDSVNHDAILRDVMKQKAAGPHFQSKVIQALGTKLKSTSLLEGYLSNENADIVNSSLYALAYKGNLESLKKINRLKNVQSTSREYEAIRFAKTMISYRHGLDKDVLTKVPTSEYENFRGVSTEEVKVSHERSKHSTEMLSSLDSNFIATELMSKNGVRLSCANQSATFFFSNRVKGQSWLEKNGILGTIVQEDYCPGGYFVKYHVLMNQLGRSNRYALHVITPKGRIVMGGSGELKSDELEIDVRSVKRPGSFPFQLHAWLSTEDLHVKIIEAWSATTIRKDRIVLGSPHKG